MILHGSLTSITGLSEPQSFETALKVPRAGWKTWPAIFATYRAAGYKPFVIAAMILMTRFADPAVIAEKLAS